MLLWGRARWSISESLRWRQRDDFARTPGMLAAIKNQNARQEFDFVIEKLKCERARQKGRVHENTSAERDIVRDRLWPAVENGDG